MSIEAQNRALRYPLGVVVLILTAFLLRAGVGRLIDTVVAGSATWLPTFGTIGQTIALYSLGVNAFVFVLLPVGAFWLGNQYGQNA